jgi:putative transposase
MPRTARSIEAEIIYHVLNRGNGRMQLFHKDEDSTAFEHALSQALGRNPVDLLTYCLMPNHWHLVVRPQTDSALGRMMAWVGATHVRRHQEHYHRRSAGHLYQGRYKSFPVAEDDYFLTLCRYVESNALRARLVERAEQWTWGGLWRRAHRAVGPVLSEWPVERPRNRTGSVNGELAPEEMHVVRECVVRGRPLGPVDWMTETARRLGLEFALRNPGRPRKFTDNE